MGLKARELAVMNEMIGEGLRIFALGARHLAQAVLELVAVENAAAEDGPEKGVNRGALYALGHQKITGFPVAECSKDKPQQAHGLRPVGEGLCTHAGPTERRPWACWACSVGCLRRSLATRTGALRVARRRGSAVDFLVCLRTCRLGTPVRILYILS